MKNSTMTKNRSNMRADALLLALLVLFQSILPVMVSAGTRYQVADINMATEKDGLSPNRISGRSDLDTDLHAGAVYPATISTEQTAPGGPDQPEVQSFRPGGADQVVDLFTGDFSYNIPLLEVDGYPINLAYSAGVAMDQEASWVGLGWNLNPGVINRQMRGIPDDFNGIDQITQEYNQKPNWTVGTSAGFNYELFSIDLSAIPGGDDGGLGISATLGVEYNNYSGYGAEFSIGPSFSIAKKIGFEVGMQYTGSSQGGASVGANVTISDGNKKTDKVVNKLSIGSSFNSRQGLEDISVKLSQEREFKYNKTETGEHDNSDHIGIGNGLGSSFNFGMSSFVPQIPFDTKANSFTARFKLAGDAVGNDPSGAFTGYFAKSSLASNTKTLRAYGYANLQGGQNYPYAMMDFNRENDASFTKNTPALPVPHLMYDVFSVSGQGVAGSYRIDRKDIGFVFDPYITSSSDGYTVGGEVGLGATFKAGIDVGASFTAGSSGAWTDGNDASRTMRYRNGTNFYRSADELAYDESEAEFQNIGASKAVYFPLNGKDQLTRTLKTSAGESFSPTGVKSLKFKRNQPLVSYTIAEVRNGFGPTSLPATSYANTQPLISHHSGAFTVTKTDGSRFYYGLPAYSKVQKNVTFAVGDGKTAGLTPDWDTRLVGYSAQDASISNNRGLDNHFNAQTIPAYAHSYMLTAVLDKDYADSDPVPGPSKGDLGGYVQFKYKQVQHYAWRNPVNASSAFHDRGLNADPTDDKANYIYGEKELWYLDTVKTKNHILVFYTSDRKDAVSVNGESGGINASNARMQKLDSLKLYSLSDFELNGTDASPVKVVHFTYDYSLCRKYPGNLESTSIDPKKGGKLTLTGVYFTYEKSYRGELAPFSFYYDYNPDYNANNTDRWGTYKPNPAGLSGNEQTSPLSNSDFPYVGYDTISSDQYAAAWNMSRIKLPTGGMTEVFYEADDYAYVQHKKAKQMFKIIGVEGCSDSKCSISNDSNKNPILYFEMIPGTSYSDYAAVGDVVYFRTLLSMNEDGNRFDYVPGYAVVEEIGPHGPNGYIRLKPGKLKDSESASYNPIAISGVQFARNYLARIIPPSSQENPQSEDADFLDIAESLIGAFTNFGELFTGPNKPIWQNEIGTIMVTGKSWIRLNNPNYRKIGGGHRVREIRTYDNWNNMVSEGGESYYGTSYQYVFDGRSSGVASYEPQIGGEENVWRVYVANDIKMTWAPDIRNYMETPFGEQFFPSPQVGYSKVLTKNLQRENVKRTATGHTVHEFYTSRDFPTIAERTDVDKKPSKFNLNLLLFTKSENTMAASQGFVVENNDMHGKPRSVEIFAEGQVSPYSSVKYYYQSSPKVIEGIAANQLDNTITVITPSGETKKVVAGRTYEALADFRENKSRMRSGNLGINLNYTMPFVFVPMILGANYAEAKNEFRSAVFAKTIERKGILGRQVVEDYNSRIETNHLAYDSETGEVLLTSVNNDFRDTVYSFSYPAHWIYDGMGQAYRNTGFTSLVSNSFTDGYNSSLNNQNLFPGDEVMVKKAGAYVRGWVTESTASGVRILLKDGTPLEGAITFLKVLRSGKRNLQSIPVGSVTLMENPLATLSGNIFNKVLTTQSIEYGDGWKKYCDCADSANANPYLTGMKGNWNPKTDYLHLSGRTQTFENNNTDIRRDGLMKSFAPYYRLANGKWYADKENWTYTTTVSQFNPFGSALESVDAIGNYSNTQIGYNQTLPVAVTTNSKRQQSGFDGFEDYMFASCPDAHFRLGPNSGLYNRDAHTGYTSMKVDAGHPVVLRKQIKEVCKVEDPCDFSQYLIGGEVKTVNVMTIDGITMSYEVIYGEPTPKITEITGGINLAFISSGPYKVEVKLIGSNGCSVTLPIIGY